jgi:hypothetical protein
MWLLAICFGFYLPIVVLLSLTCFFVGIKLMSLFHILSQEINPGLNTDLLWETDVKASHAPHIFYAAIAWNILVLACSFLLPILELICLHLRLLLSYSRVAVSSLLEYPFRSSIVHSYEWLVRIEMSSKGLAAFKFVCAEVRLMGLALFMSKAALATSLAWMHLMQVT